MTQKPQGYYITNFFLYALPDFQLPFTEAVHTSFTKKSSADPIKARQANYNDHAILPPLLFDLVVRLVQLFHLLPDHKIRSLVMKNSWA